MPDSILSHRQPRAEIIPAHAAADLGLEKASERGPDDYECEFGQVVLIRR